MKGDPGWHVRCRLYGYQEVEYAETDDSKREQDGPGALRSTPGEDECTGSQGQYFFHVFPLSEMQGMGVGQDCLRDRIKNADGQQRPSKQQGQLSYLLIQCDACSGEDEQGSKKIRDRDEEGGVEMCRRGEDIGQCAIVHCEYSDPGHGETIENAADVK